MSKKTTKKSDKGAWISKRLAASAQQECNNAIKLLNKEKHDHVGEDVYEIRQNFKKIRALLRLARDEKDNYSRENKFFRDEARKIASVRHANSMIEGLDLIQQQYNERIYKKAFSDIRIHLEEHRDKEVEKVLQENHVLQDMHQNLEPRCEKTTSFFKGVDSFKTIGSGIKRVYKRGKKAHTKALNSKSTSNLHDLKKRVNYLIDQLDAINPVWPKFLKAWSEELHELSAFLGSYRDLAMLNDYLQENNTKISTEDGAYLLGTLITGHQDQLRKHAILLGKKLYYLDPKDFIALLEVAWETHASGMDKKLIPSDKLER
ncbi:MAG TPA: CHAD domain-containing protein [Leeuwenhoekiella sp.]|nr:CHAD domain-containing protein [Leeuwenhoekiella sp.]